MVGAHRSLLDNKGSVNVFSYHLADFAFPQLYLLECFFSQQIGRLRFGTVFVRYFHRHNDGLVVRLVRQGCSYDRFYSYFRAVIPIEGEKLTRLGVYQSCMCVVSAQRGA